MKERIFITKSEGKCFAAAARLVASVITLLFMRVLHESVSGDAM